MAEAESEAPVEVGSEPQAEIVAAAPETGLADSTWRWLRAAAIVATLYFGYQLLMVVRTWVELVFQVILLLVFAIIVALVTQPLVDGLERRARLPRTAAILLVLAGLLLLIIGGAFLLAEPIASEALSLSTQVPGLLRRLQAEYGQLAPSLRDHGIYVDLGGLVQSLTAEYQSRIGPLLIGGIRATLETLVNFLIVLVLSFWVLKDGPGLRDTILRWIPTAARGPMGFGLDAVAAVIGGYARAQLLMAVLIAVLAGVGCWLIGVPFPLVVGVTAAVFELVPIIGPFAGGAVAVLLALTRGPT